MTVEYPAIHRPHRGRVRRLGESGAPMIEVMELCDVWFEPSKDGCRLIVATCSPRDITQFHVRLKGGVSLKFEHLADVKNQRLFEASLSDLAHAGGPGEQGLSLQLSGPLRRVCRLQS